LNAERACESLTNFFVAEMVIAVFLYVLNVQIRSSKIKNPALKDVRVSKKSLK
jgi:capsid protein